MRSNPDARIRSCGSVQLLPPSSLVSNTLKIVADSVWMLPATMMRLPDWLAAVSSKKVSHGSSSVQLKPADRISSSEQRNGTTIGLPEFSKTGCGAVEAGCWGSWAPATKAKLKIRINGLKYLRLEGIMKP